MDRLKKISILWGILAVLLFAFLTTMGFIYKNRTQKYKDLEEDLVKATKKYTATDFNFPVNGQNIVITLDELKDTGLIKELRVENKKCNGYVIVSFNNVTDYKAYINCEKYKTHGYEKSNLEN